MNIKEIIPEQNNTRQRLTAKKPVQTLVNAETNSYEWLSNVSVSDEEAVFIAQRLNIKGKIPVERFKKVKAAVIEGLKQREMLLKFKNEKGLTISAIKKIRSALSDFNGWDLSGRN